MAPLRPSHSKAGGSPRAAAAKAAAAAAAIKSDLLQTPIALKPLISNLTPVALDRVVTVNGQMGVFTPITRAPDEPADPTSQDNLQAILASLKDEVARLQQNNLALQGQLAAVATVPRSPEDFAAAVQRSLDKLQGQLATMTNPVSNFAVKEFRLETNVVVDVSALGDVVYRFPDPAQKPDPATLSHITLDVVPMPKTATTGVFTPDLFQPEVSVKQIEGLTTHFQSLLHQNQIDTVGDLLAVGTRVRSVTELVALLKIDRNRLATWITSAQLMSLRGIDGGRATILAAAGVTTLAALAAITPALLSERFAAALAKSQRVDVKPIGVDEATSLVKAAAAFVGTTPPAVEVTPTPSTSTTAPAPGR